METIKIKSLKLLNFKGTRNLIIDFNPSETNIRGANASGKTTVFDAFTWLLFGKNSKGATSFGIKTYDENNNVIERIPHEVSAILDVNGQEVTLKKSYNEMWVKKRGAETETFEGHRVDCYYNDVPCSVREYNQKIAELCDEQVFRLITNPLFFPNQSRDFQRSMLFQLAGDVTNEDIVANNPHFAGLVNSLSGKTLEEYKKEIASKKKVIKEGIENIPARIDERKRDVPEAKNWSEFEKNIAQLEQKLKEVNAQIADRSKIYEEATKQKQEIAKRLSETKTSITTREYELKDQLLADYHKAKKENENAIARVDTLNNDRRFKSVSLQRAEKELAELNEKRNTLLEEWREIKTRTISFNEDEFVCPTCKQEFKAEDIESKKAQMLADFNDNINRSLETNKTRGLETKAGIEAKESEIKSIKDAIFEIDTEVSRVSSSKAYKEAPVMPDVQPIIDADATILELRKQADELQKQLDEETKAPDLSELNEKRSLIESDISRNKVSLSDRDRIELNNNRIVELEKEYAEGQAKITEYEGIEFNIQQFNKAKIEQIEAKVNGLFSIVKFKMFEQLINGGEVETCEAMVGGIPYSDLNDAMKVNAGLDIINAISKANGISAPIFIDARESVTEIIPVIAQVINLIVDGNYKTLKIE